MMKTAWVLTLLATTIGAQNSFRRLDGSRIDTQSASQIAQDALTKAHAVGAQIAVTQNGKTVWTYAWGLREKNPDKPMQPDTTTWAASITKSVFATYVMKLVEEKQLHLDTPLATMLSKPLDQYEGYKESAKQLVKDPQWQSVTPRMVLSHSSGLGNFALFEPDRQMHLHSAPGTMFRYSGEGLNVLQLAIEEQQGKPLEVLMQSAIFNPLGMTGTGMKWDPAWESNIADRFNADGSFHDKTRKNRARAAGNMSSSARDLATFTNAFLAGQIIRPATVRQMLTPQESITSTHQFPFAGDAATSAETTRIGLAYGLGWGLLTKTAYGPAFFKEGHGDGAQNYLICFTAKKTCMIVLTNSDNGEFAFRTLFEKILGDNVTPWEWECYTESCITAARKFE